MGVDFIRLEILFWILCILLFFFSGSFSLVSFYGIRKVCYILGRKYTILSTEGFQLMSGQSERH